MAANGFGERFYSLRSPMWHGQGVVGQTNLTAVEAFSQIGEYDVSIQDIYAVMPGIHPDEAMSDHIKLTDRAVVRHPTHDSPEFKRLGLVGPEYVLISPKMICELWDSAVGAHVETMGALYGGSTFYISTFLPTIDIRGDEVKMYLLAVSPMSGAEAYKTHITGWRVVCSNTLKMGEKAATETYRIVHDKHAPLKLRASLDGVYSRATGRVAKFKELFELMADRQITNDELNAFIETVYVLPQQPQVDGLPSTVAESRMLNWEMNTRYYQTRRELVLADFQGAGVGMDTKAAAGTVWGAVNAVAEVESHLRRGSTVSLMENFLGGDRGRAVSRAFEYAELLVK